MFIDLKNKINSVNNRLESYLSVLVTKRSNNEKRNKKNLKLFANNFYQRFINHNVNDATRIYKIDKSKFFRNIVENYQMTDDR